MGQSLTSEALNLTHFGMSIPEALDAPTVFSENRPSSLRPGSALPRPISVEDRIWREAIGELDRRGHEIVVAGSWVHGKPMATRYRRENGVIAGGVSRRRSIGYAMG